MSSTVKTISNDILSCQDLFSDLWSDSITNVRNMFSDPMERSIALLVRNAFTYYTWEETVSSFNKSIQSFLDSNNGKSIVFVFHAENSSSSSQNLCYQKSSFFFTLLALELSSELKRRTIGFVCNDMYTLNPKILNNRSDIVYCICEDSIYSGDQITKVIGTLQSRNKMDLTKIHVICPFVREEFVQQSVSKKYHLHTDIWVPSLMTMLTDPDVIEKTCSQINAIRLTQPDDFADIELCKDLDNIDVILAIFPQRMRHTPVFFSHKIADATSIPLPWVLGLLGLGSFSTIESESYIANEHVKNTSGEVWSCMRGPYKNRSEELLVIFNDMFKKSFGIKKKSLFSRMMKK